MKKVLFLMAALAMLFTACNDESADIQETQIDMSDFYVYTDADVDEIGRSLANGKNKGKSCYTMANLNRLLNEDPGLEKRMYDIEYNTRKIIARNNAKPGNGNGGGRPGGDDDGGGGGGEVTGIINIPVIVHVISSNDAEDISDQQISSQIAVLNDDFNRLNDDASNTPDDFISIAANSEIQFTLAQTTRTSTNRQSWGTNDAMKYTSNGGHDVITPETHLNIWICTIGSNILGYAQFPGGPAVTDGIVVDSRFFGTTGTATSPFDLGRTATHEVGHYLNLRHIWGDGGCNVDDFVSDTPTAGGPNYTGIPCSYPGPNSCRPKGRRGQADEYDMFQNYMDYSDDACMNLFTIGQKSRMRAVFAAGGPRDSMAPISTTP